jgi:hypothetical protein
MTIRQNLTRKKRWLVNRFRRPNLDSTAIHVAGNIGFGLVAKDALEIGSWTASRTAPFLADAGSGLDNLISNDQGGIVDSLGNLSQTIGVYSADLIGTDLVQYLDARPEGLYVATLLGLGAMLPAFNQKVLPKVVRKFRNLTSSISQPKTRKWATRLALGIPTAFLLYQGIQSSLPTRFVATGDQTSGGYDIFEYRGPNPQTYNGVSDIFDEWDESRGDNCRNTGSLNVFIGDNGRYFIKAGCGESKPAKVSGFKPTPGCKAEYEPYSEEAKALFRKAAPLAGVPTDWGNSESLHWILKRESGGKVGIPNYTIKTASGRSAKNDPSTWNGIHKELKSGKLKPGSWRARSSATGLGQLLLSNAEKYYPHGKQGIGDCKEEAAGMLAYIDDRYGSPEKAKSLYGKLHEGYNVGTDHVIPESDLSLHREIDSPWVSAQEDPSWKLIDLLVR